MVGNNIFITGSLGYIGMELCKLYSGLSRHNKITVIDNKFYSSRVSQLKKWGINFSRQTSRQSSYNLIN